MIAGGEKEERNGGCRRKILSNYNSLYPVFAVCSRIRMQQGWACMIGYFESTSWGDAVVTDVNKLDDTEA